MREIESIKLQIKKVFAAFCLTMQSSYFYTLVGVALSIALVLIDYLGMYTNKEILNGVQQLTSGKNEVVVAGIVKLLAFSVLLIFIKSIIEVLGNYFSNKRLSVFQQYIDGQIVSKCQTLDISCFDSPQFYNRLEQVNATKRMLGYLVYRVLFVTKALFMVIPAAVILVVVEQWYIVAGIVILMIPSFLYRGKCDYKLMQYENDNKQASREMSYWCKIVFAKESAKELRLFNFTDYVVGKYSELIDKFIAAKKKIISKYGFQESIVKLLPYLCVFIGGVELFYRAVDGMIELGDFLYYIGIYLTFISNFDEVFNEFATVKQHMVAYDKYIDFKNMKSLVKDEGMIELKNPVNIEFDNVWFRYPNTDHDILCGLSCSFKYSEKVAIVGLNGEGKTTIIKLLLRFYDPQQGTIKINGRNIKEYSIMSLRKHFGLAFQDFNIFSMSIRDNVAISNYGRRDEDEVIKECLNFSGFHLDCELDCDLRKDYCENGRELSGGEEQKIAIARCLFSDAEFLIMDEPTASLDAYAEAELMEKYEKIYQNKGLLLVSHRLNNVRKMDKIIVLKNGVILECGCHQELMDKRGEYCRLFTLQAERF